MKLELMDIPRLACVLALTAWIVGCEGDTINNNLPSGPSGVCEAAAPPTFSAAVTPRGTCSTTGCVADYSGTAAGAVRFGWSFTGGTPSESADASGSVTFTNTGAGSKSFTWSARACSCSAGQDISGLSCKSASGVVTFSG